MSIMGPNDIKEDVYDVMTISRELTNYCQESVNSVQSKKISTSLNNFHSKTSIDFVTKSMNNDDRLFFELNKFDFDTSQESENIQIYNKVIDYIENYFINFNS